jgi:hypothetical protein
MKRIFGLWAAFCKFHVKQMVLECLFTFFAIPRYTLLAGCTPFETMLIKDVYSTKKKNEFHVSSRIGPLARTLIIKMLQADPSKR